MVESITKGAGTDPQARRDILFGRISELYDDVPDSRIGALAHDKRLVKLSLRQDSLFNKYLAERLDFP